MPIGLPSLAGRESFPGLTAQRVVNDLFTEALITLGRIYNKMKEGGQGKWMSTNLECIPTHGRPEKTPLG